MLTCVEAHATCTFLGTDVYTVPPWYIVNKPSEGKVEEQEDVAEGAEHVNRSAKGG